MGLWAFICSCYDEGMKTVVSWGLRRQLVGFLLFLILAVASGYGIYTQLIPRATCSDGRQNSTETGVDCGGACSRVCSGEAEDLRVAWSKVFPSTIAGAYDVAALVLNPNLAHGLSELHYRFSLFDADNKLVAEREGDTFVNPGEQVALYEPNIATGRRVPLRAYVQFEGPEYELPWRKGLIPIRPVLSVDSAQLNAEEDPELVGQLANRSIADAVGIQAVAILLDKDEVPIGVRSSYFDSLKRNKAIPLFFSWPGLPKNTVPVAGEVYPRSTAEGIK